ncbi:TetR family transcriptional regulator [Georgenia thermotolerans]|uniref:TetR family transcriptional regulator n=1 Tax=Georgenia thermotolerans TaxID=527326 RepID=A0A7J5UU00_9MICO|nr:TetR family transcriptional regulator [Georgenia thermotolerans]KAE8765752.1 TetR family transcriptional regulator [Georgenia thermotolerans]
MEDDAAPDLRTRRRLDTRMEIQEAALELFEEQGVRETTVQQIAERAGVSARTFFRYFATKEQAALPGQHRLVRAIDAMEFPDADPAAVLRAVEQAAEAVMAGENDPELAEHRRVARLLARERDLRSLAASQEQLLIARLRARLADRLGGDAASLLLVAEIAVAVWRAAWDRWGELALEGEVRDPVEVYRACRSDLRRIVG